ncbi:hypothetical protein BC828DRAFT_387804 [Blastocladiella britannica]|nr:hypothetical protein BC828DRAFT_387804 [Blastocladiella britannica]
MNRTEISTCDRDENTRVTLGWGFSRTAANTSAPVPRRSVIMCCEATSRTLVLSANARPMLVARVPSTTSGRARDDALKDPADGERARRMDVGLELRRALAAAIAAAGASNAPMVLIALGASWIGVGSDVSGYCTPKRAADPIMVDDSPTVSASVLAQRTPAAAAAAAATGSAASSVLETKCHLAMVCLTVSAVDHRTSTTPTTNPTTAAGISEIHVPCDPLEFVRFVGPFAMADMARHAAIAAVAAAVTPARSWLVTVL